MEYILENDFIKLTVTSKGGTMRSILYKPTGEERLWQGSDFWKSQDVVIFPILGHAEPYTVAGREYVPKSHGVVRYAELNCIQKGESEITLALSSNEETKKTYPYDFVFAVSYRLNQNAITVTYHVAAKAGSIPFYVGGHPGMVAPNGQAVIEFGQSENAVVYPLETDGSVAMPKLKSFVANKEFFRQCKTFQVGNIASGKVSLTTEDGYRYHYISNCPVWAFWSNEEGGDYVCVEPWWGINDFAKAPRELSLKPFINFADEEGKEFSYTLQINKDK